jgi:mono/diheme cytochrome c family protein
LPDLERGRALYENHCVVCHTAKVHRRVPPLPLGVDDLRFIVAAWATQEGLRWNRDEIDDVVYYLDRVHYRFEK